MHTFHKNTSALDPELLKTPFEMQTNWHVLTGAACTGKTTLVGLLSGHEFQVLPESARDYFEQEQDRGLTIDQILADTFTLQCRIAELQEEYERRLQPKTVAFLDRALPDSISFFRYWGMDTSLILRKCFHYQYKSVFLLDRLPLHRDVVLGPEDEAASAFLDTWLERDYSTLGYHVVRVPPLPPAERLNLILQTISSNT